MAKRIKKINVTSDKKGTVKNPYTIEEHEQMLAEGQWTEDGFVEELGLVEGESTNPPMYDMYEFFEYDGEWPGGFVNGLGYVAPDVEVIGTYDPNYGVKVADGIAVDQSVKNAVLSLIDEKDATNAVNKYIKFNTLCGKGLGAYSLVINITEAIRDPATNKCIKAVVSLIILAATPGVSMIYTFADITGGLDKVIDEISDKINSIILK